MLVRTPLVQAQQHGFIRIENLAEVIVGRRRIGLAEERLVPPDALPDIPDADDRPGAFHRQIDR
jgi:hypothetical protein